MNRTQYRQARRMLRDNGRFALKWLDTKGREVMDALMDALMGAERDKLAERADIISHCQAIGIECNARHTAELGLLARFQDRKAAAGAA